MLRRAPGIVPLPSLTPSQHLPRASLRCIRPRPRASGRSAMNIKVRPAFRCPQKKPGALAAQVGDFRLPGLERTAFVRVFVRALTRRMSGFLGFEIDKDASLAIIATLPSPCVHGWPSGAQLLPRCREPGQARGRSTKFQPPAPLRTGCFVRLYDRAVNEWLPMGRHCGFRIAGDP
jgi:hypothetical protein